MLQASSSQKRRRTAWHQQDGNPPWMLGKVSDAQAGCRKATRHPTSPLAAVLLPPRAPPLSLPLLALHPPYLHQQDLDGLTEEELLAQIEQLDPEAAAAARAAGAAGSGAPSSIEGTALVLEAAPPSSPAAPSSADPSKLNEVLKEMERLTTENEAMKAGKLG